MRLAIEIRHLHNYTDWPKVGATGIHRNVLVTYTTCQVAQGGAESFVGDDMFTVNLLMYSAFGKYSDPLTFSIFC
jgi:hypothetical protein